MNDLRINSDRLWDSLMELAKIGATPKGGERALAARVIPDASGDDASGLGDAPHLGEPFDRIAHEMDNQLRESGVESLSVERKLLGRRLLHLDARVPLADRRDERRRRVRRGDGIGAQASHQLAGQHAGTAPDVEHALTG